MGNKWRTTAIVFICLFVAIISFNIWAYTLIVDEEAEANNCYYNICEEYIDAWYEEGLCTCYNIDEQGVYEIAKTEYKK